MNIKRIKYIAAFFLLICLVLPMSRCAKIGPPHPEGDTAIKKEEATEYSYLIPLAEVEIQKPSTYLIILAFIWPFPFWLIKSTYDKKWSIKIFYIAEFILLAFSWYTIANALYLREILWGGYIAVASVSVLSIFYLYQVVSDLKAKNKTKTNLTSKST